MSTPIVHPHKNCVLSEGVSGSTVFTRVDNGSVVHPRKNCVLRDTVSSIAILAREVEWGPNTFSAMSDYFPQALRVQLGPPIEVDGAAVAAPRPPPQDPNHTRKQQYLGTWSHTDLQGLKAPRDMQKQDFGLSTFAFLCHP